MNAILVLLIVGVSILLVDIVFGKTSSIISLQREAIKNRTALLRNMSVEEFLDECNIIGDDRPTAKKLVNFLGNLLDVAPEKIARDSDMLSLLGYTDPASKEVFLPFVDDLIDGLIKLSDKELWEKKWFEYPELPNGEDDFIELIMKMTLKEFLIFFTPLLKR